MKGRLLSLAAGTVFAFGLASGTAIAQSAKFAASWDEDPIWTSAFAACDVEGGVDCPVIDGFNTTAEMDMATIHIAQHKSVLIGVSGQVGIGLLTAAKGKSAGSSTAVAAAGVLLGLELYDEDQDLYCTVEPGPVIFDGQLQALKVSASTSGDDEIEVGVGLLTAEASAHHFNFLGIECEQGTYTATAYFGLGALAAAFGQESLAGALVVLGNRIITLQEVRAVKGSLIPDAGDPPPDPS